MHWIWINGARALNLDRVREANMGPEGRLYLWYTGVKEELEEILELTGDDARAAWEALQRHVTPGSDATTEASEATRRIVGLEEQAAEHLKAIDALRRGLEETRSRLERIDGRIAGIHKTLSRQGTEIAKLSPRLDDAAASGPTVPEVEAPETADSSTPQSLDSKPLPCPFCGKAPRVIGSGETWHSVRCEMDGCPARAPLYRLKDKAIAAWNQRAPSLEIAGPIPPDGAADRVDIAHEDYGGPVS